MTIADDVSSIDVHSDAPYDVVVVGGGAAGVGVSIALKHAGVESFVVLERSRVGASFDAWPAETRFITPSFPSNSIGMLDLNSIPAGERLHRQRTVPTHRHGRQL